MIEVCSFSQLLALSKEAVVLCATLPQGSEMSAFSKCEQRLWL